MKPPLFSSFSYSALSRFRSFPILLFSYFLIILFSFFLLPFSAHGAVISKSSSPTGLQSGLVGWWSFDGKDVVNGKVKDRSGQGNDGSPSGIATSTFYSIGKIGQGFSFDGVDDRVNLGSFSSIATAAKTLSMWVKPTNITSDSRLISNTNNTTFSVRVSSGKVQIWSDSDGDGWSDVVNTAGGVGLWTHYVFVFNGSGTVIGYKNGVIQQTATTNTASWSTLALGAPLELIYGGYFKGMQDDVRIYNRALSATEVTALYNQGGAGKANASKNLSLTSGLVVLLSFDGKDVVNGKVKDRSGQGNDGSPSGIATTTFYVQGKIGQAVKFNASSNQNVRTALSASQVVNSGSASFWFKAGTQTGTALMLDGGKDGNNFYAFRWNAGGVRFYSYDANVNEFLLDSDSTLLFDNKWHHVAGSWNTSNAYLYIDGVRQTSVFTGDATLTLGASALTMVGDYLSGGGAPYNGNIDEVRVYNRTLSATEVKALYNMGGTKQNASRNNAGDTLRNGLVGLWSFDGKDVVNGKVKDRSGQGNDGSPVSIATSTFYAQGKIGQGFRFDGVDDRVSTGATLPSSGAFTVSLWMKKIQTSGNQTIFVQDASGDIQLFYSPSNNGFGYKNALDVTDDLTGWTYTLDSNWHHLVFIENYTGDVDGDLLYVDGVQITSQWAGLSVNPVAPTFQIGGSVGGLFWGGVLDDVRVYNRSLSATEVKQLYNLGK
ncbi:MAG: LamG domain-containing protein [bacterium]|nr:LamG domain-containing protein [bacterium]